MSYVPGERWDRDRFERERAGSRRAPVLEREYDEHDYYSRPGFREERDVHEDDYRRGPASSVGRGERDRVFFEEREQYGAPVPYRPRRESVRYYDERETVANRDGDMVPYREREDDREIDIKFTRESQPSRRPQFIRRQSSLDTFDRKPLPRYGDRVREEVVIPRPPRRRSPPRFVERDYEEIRVAEPEYYGDEEYRPYREREVETFRRRYPDHPPPPPREEEIIEEREEVIREFPKRGKTRMPRRLVSIKAIINLGYPYEEEGETIVIQKALGKDHIDEVIRISREINEAAPPPPPEEHITYEIEAPAPQPPPSMVIPPPMEHHAPPPPPFEEEIIKHETKIIRENPSLAETSTVSSRSSSPSASTVTAHSRRSHRHSNHYHHKSRSRAHSRSTHRSKSTRRHRSLSAGTSGRELVIRPHGAHDTALIVPDGERRSQRSIQAEIKALEAEKKALKYEREAERYRHGNEVIIEKEYRDGVVEVKKDRRAPDPRLLRAMMATLT